MKERDFYLHDGKTGSAITVRVTPRASRNEISEILDDGTLKVRLAAGQRDENLNQTLISFLSEVLQVSPSQVEIIGGQEGNDKLVSITDLSKSVVHTRILNHLK
jgi:uncharacterized protein